MKPIRLKLAGLHSYREMQEIDFETLCEAGLFGIFGPTGSGKSTILDAITLALYGQVVRIGGGTHPQEALNQLEDRLFVSFTFELGRAEERRRYTIEREFRLDKNGKRRQPEVRLIERSLVPGEPDRVLESKATAATAAVEQLIGLTIHDFTRAVVLPQGQFSKFLTLKGSERNDMLQRIFQLHEYGEKLNERVRAAYEANKAELHRLEIELAALGEAGPDALKEAAAALESTREQETAMGDERERLYARKQELAQLRQWQQEREEVAERLRALAAEEAEIERLARRIAAIEAGVTLWPLLAKARQLEAEWQEAEQTFIRRRAEQEEAARRHEESEQAYRQAWNRLQSEEPTLLEQAGKLAQAAEWEKELDELSREIETGTRLSDSLRREVDALGDQLVQQERQLAAWQSQLAEIDRQLQDVTVTADERKRLQALLDAKKSWERARANEAEAARERDEIERQRQQAAAQAARLHAAWQQAIREREQAQARLNEAQTLPVATDAELEAMRDVLARVRTLGKEWREAAAAQAELRTKREDWERSWRQAEHTVLSLESAWQQAEAARVSREHARQQAEADWLAWQQEDMARTLRHKLVEGQPCPVCGSSHHPLGPEGNDTDGEAARGEEAERLRRMEEVRAALVEAEQAARTAHDALQAARLEQAALQQRADMLKDEETALNRRLAAIAAELSSLGEVWRVEDIDQLLERYRAQEAVLRARTEERERHKSLADERQQQAAALRERELEAKAAFEKNSAVLEQLAERLDVAQTRWQQAEAEAGVAQTELTRLLGELTVEDVEAEYARLEQQDAALEQLRKRRGDLEDRLKRLQDAWQEQKERRLERAAQEAAVRERLQERRELWERKHALWRERTGGERAQTVLGRIEAERSRLRADAEQAEQARQRAAEHRQAIQESLVKAEEAYAQLSRQRMEAETALARELAASGLTPAEVEELYAERDKLPGYRERVEQFRTLIDQLRYEEQRLAEKLGGRSVGPEEWEAVTAALDELELALQSVRDQVAVARETLARIEANHEKWTALQERLTALADEQSRLEDIKKLLEGKAFVQFIAEEKLSSIARDASYHLARMTKNRYALEIGADGEFVLRDEAAGGLRRPVSTLSGGETFLTSLSLALALSVEIQMRGGRLEFFFLDEGFGTLDPDLLEVVMDALERLRMNEFTIGLISHVPELRARMPRRLVITPAEPMGAGSRIRMEID